MNSMGADVRGAGTDVIKIRGVEHMHGATYSIIPDQIEAGTFMVAAAATNGDVLVKNVIPKHLESITAKLVAAGATVEEFDDAVRVTRSGPLKKDQPENPAPSWISDGSAAADGSDAIHCGRDKHHHRRRVGQSVQVCG